MDTLEQRTFYGREKDNLIYPIALANLVLHGIDEPHIWHGNTLTQQATLRAACSPTLPPRIDVILTNPPFGGKEGKEAQTHFTYKTGRDAGALSAARHQQPESRRALRHRAGRGRPVPHQRDRVRQDQAQAARRLRSVVHPQPARWRVHRAGAGVKTNLLFFTKGQKTERIWYYDLSDVKVGKKTPMTLDKFEEFFDLLPTFADSERSWTIDLTARRAEARQQADPLKTQAQQLDTDAARSANRPSNSKPTSRPATRTP